MFQSTDAAVSAEPAVALPGMIVPPVHVADNLQLGPRGYSLLLKGGRAPFDFFRANPWAADNFLRYATRVAHAHKHDARAAMSSRAFPYEEE